jgi:hypothetical protein
VTENREIIIPRKKSKSIGYTIFMFAIAALFLFLAVIYFFDVPGINADDMPLVAVALILLATPIFIWCGIIYFKQIFNENPILTVNAGGITEQTNKIYTGLIRWEDIEEIKVIPYMDNTYWIGIVLKRPEKYIENEKLLKRHNKQRDTIGWAGHIAFTSLYYKKQIGEVSDTMQYYLAKSKAEAN